jgi:hypothetical protein
MAVSRFHYERAFEHYLRSKAIPYVAVDEARRAIASSGHDATSNGLKNFDYVVYSESGPNLLVDVKGRKCSGRPSGSFQNWVTADDVDSLIQWRGIFGQGFDAAFAFLFWCDAAPPDALFHEVFEFGGKWYAVLAMTLDDYRSAMRPRSVKWETVDLPAAVFRDRAQPLEVLLKKHTSLKPA